jgi:hypothetical protein
MTDARQIVARQLDHSGSILMLGMEPLDDGEFFAELKTGFSPAWTVGHIACFADLFSAEFDNRQLLFGPEFHQVFNDTEVAGAGPVSKAASVDPGRYPKMLLLLRFRQAVTKALRTLHEFNTGQWDDMALPGTPVSLLTKGAVWERLAVHIYWHCGELAGSMPRFRDTYALNIIPHHFYLPKDA